MVPLTRRSIASIAEKINRRSPKAGERALVSGPPAVRRQAGP